MADRPILFSAPMVRALLDGRKTQTRRILKPQPTVNGHGLLIWERTPDYIQGTPEDLAHGQRIKVGDRLWVRETWQGLTCGDFRPTKHEPCEVRYFSTDPCADLDVEARGYAWRPSIFMPRWASRITLHVTKVRVKRLQDITRGDAIEEGCPFANMAIGPDPRDWFRAIWAEINEPGAWNANPWVVAYTFTVERNNIDETSHG